MGVFQNKVKFASHPLENQAMAEVNNLGARIKQLRSAQNLSVEDLAERSRLQANQIEKIEKEGIVPSLSPSIKIARALGVRLGTFLA